MTVAAMRPKKGLAYDMDAARAARAEKVGDPFQFRFGGKSFTLPPPNEWPVTVTAHLAEGRIVDALTALLGADQAPGFLALDPTMGDVEGLLEAAAQWAGLGGLPN